MKKLILILSLLSLTTLLALHFTTFHQSQSYTLPVSSIDHGNLNNLYINLNNGNIKVPQTNTEFYLIKDKKYGNPNGSFTLTKNTNIFGLTRFEAHINK